MFFDLSCPMAQRFRLARGRLILAAFVIHHKSRALSSASQPFIFYATPEKRKAASSLDGRGLARLRRRDARAPRQSNPPSQAYNMEISPLP